MNFMNEQEKYLKRIRHNYDEVFFKRFVGESKRLGLMKFFFDKIEVGGIENVLKVKDRQIVYISNHVSLADFLVQGYVFGTRDLPVPRFIAGENLNHFPFGVLWKKCGAISIDRNMKYKSYWRAYAKEIERVLQGKENLLIYPEGGRSYSGKISNELKTGSLRKVIKWAGEEGVWAIPTFIKYDKRIEEGFLEGIKKNKLKRDLHLERGKRYDTEGKFFRASGEYLFAGVQDRMYFSKDVFAYFKRALSFNKGKVYLKFGEGFNLNKFKIGNGNGRNDLRGKVVWGWRELRGY